MSKSYLAEAFEELELVDDDKLTGTFDFDKKGAEDLKKFMEDDTFNDFETVIDPEAETEEDLQDSYIGMGILGCDICHSMIYKPIEDIVIDEETQMANVGECCPYCYERDGFKIIGKVAPFEDISVEVEKTEDGEEVPEPTVKVNGKDVPVEEAPDKEEEALTAEQKYPVQSPISENINKKIVSKRRVQESTNSEKLFSTFPDLEDAGSETPVATTKPAKQKPTKIRKGSNVDKLFTTFPDLKENKIEEELSNSEKLFRAFPELREPIKESINEGMEDISITTDDQVIKVKATPREDKETIVPMEPKEIEAA